MADFSLETLQAEPLSFVVVEVSVEVCVLVAEFVLVGGGYGAQLLGATARPPSTGTVLVDVRMLRISLGTTGAFTSWVLQKTSVHADAP
jgi:hypothetical protein